MLLAFVAHVDGHRMMVGAHNTVGCQMHVGGYVVFVWVWQISVLAYTVDAQRHVRSFTMCSRYGKSRALGMVNPGAHNTVDAQRRAGEPYRIGV